eukprot:56125_1
MNTEYLILFVIFLSVLYVQYAMYSTNKIVVYNVSDNQNLTKTFTKLEILQINPNITIDVNAINVTMIEMAMTMEERRFFIKTVYNANNYLEWGSGGSTI